MYKSQRKMHLYLNQWSKKKRGMWSINVYEKIMIHSFTNRPTSFYFVLIMYLKMNVNDIILWKCFGAVLSDCRSVNHHQYWSSPPSSLLLLKDIITSWAMVHQNTVYTLRKKPSGYNQKGLYASFMYSTPFRFYIEPSMEPKCSR